MCGHVATQTIQLRGGGLKKTGSILFETGKTLDPSRVWLWYSMLLPSLHCHLNVPPMHARGLYSMKEV